MDKLYDDANLLEVKDLRTYFYQDSGVLKAVDGVNFNIKKGKTLGIVGESGCGKSVTALSIMRIVLAGGKLEGGSILLRLNSSENKSQLLDLGKMHPKGESIRKIRGKEISMVFQEPMTSFSPVHTIGNQIMEAMLLHNSISIKDARKYALEMLNKVGISNPIERLESYPHQLSGGMRQRAMMAMALSCNPSLLIADEPTTALDVTVQAQIIYLLKDLQSKLGMSILYITHDLGVIAELADHVAVMYLGKIVEYTNVDRLFHDAKHPYTMALLKAIPNFAKSRKEKLSSIKGRVPLPVDLPKACGFYQRCPHMIKGRCDVLEPELSKINGEHEVRCFLYS